MKEKILRCFECGKRDKTDYNGLTNFVMEIAMPNGFRYFCDEDCVESALCRVKRKKVKK